MMYMLHMLTAAAADAEMRQDMNVEDEYYKAIEDHDTTIMRKDQVIKDREKEICQKNEQLQQLGEQLKRMAKALSASGMSPS